MIVCLSERDPACSSEVARVEIRARVVAGSPSEADLRAVADWIRLNAAAIFDHWRGTISAGELIQLLRRLP